MKSRLVDQFYSGKPIRELGFWLFMYLDGISIPARANLGGFVLNHWTAPIYSNQFCWTIDACIQQLYMDSYTCCLLTGLGYQSLLVTAT